jgi:hypothetical protein
MREQFVFGYGSLINPESRSKTVGTDGVGTAIPVLVNGLRRGWNARIRSDESQNWPYSMTALGVVFQENESSNGVLIPVSDGELEKFDEREKGYSRRQIGVNAISFLTEREIPPDNIVHAYVWDTPLPANEEFPILQSYVDVVMAGCLELGWRTDLGSFATDFVHGTAGWDSYWIDDRMQPKYIRAMRETPLLLARQIDGILEGNLGKVLATRKLVLRTGNDHH